MITIDGKWRMEGLDRADPKRIKTHQELSEYINEFGFLPLFKNSVEGFSVEEMTAADSWWGNVSEEDPWQWREVIAGEGEIAYGKLFANRAGFISKEWYPIFATYRRDGYDFDSRYEDGLASYRAKKIMDLLETGDSFMSNDIKTMAGFEKGGEKGFEGVMTTLQMQTYITVNGFRRRTNKKKQEYGWAVASFCMSEKLYGEDYVRSSYHISAKEAKDRLIDQIMSRFKNADISQILKVI